MAAISPEEAEKELKEGIGHRKPGVPSRVVPAHPSRLCQILKPHSIPVMFGFLSTRRVRQVTGRPPRATGGEDQGKGE